MLIWYLENRLSAEITSIPQKSFLHPQKAVEGNGQSMGFELGLFRPHHALPLTSPVALRRSFSLRISWSVLQRRKMMTYLFSSWNDISKVVFYRARSWALSVGTTPITLEFHSFFLEVVLLSETSLVPTIQYMGILMTKRLTNLCADNFLKHFANSDSSYLKNTLFLLKWQLIIITLSLCDFRDNPGGIVK